MEYQNVHYLIMHLLRWKLVVNKDHLATTLTTVIAEKNKLLDYSIHMAEIGYGRTREQIFSTENCR